MDAERRVVRKQLGVGGATSVETIGIGGTVLAGWGDEPDVGHGSEADITTREDTPGSTTETPVVENLSVTGSGSKGVTIMLEGRNGPILRICTFEQTEADRNGVYLRDSLECRIVNSDTNFERNPLIPEESTVSIENTDIVGPVWTQEITEMQVSGEDFTTRGEK